MKISGKLPPRKADQQRSDRQAGDDARDVKNWSRAEAAYRRHLDKVSNDAPIWVQYGHCVKEQGRLEEAEQAYRNSIKLESLQADTYLQLGHVLKLQEKIFEAGEAYARSIALKPTKVAHDELAGLGEHERARQILLQSSQESTAEILFEIDDLLGYLSAHVTVSGIQRVQVGILSAMLAGDVTNLNQYLFVRSRSDTDTLWALDPALLRALFQHCSEPVVSHRKVLQIISQLEQSATIVSSSANQCYLILGAFWGFNGDATRYARLRAAGVRVGVYIYDLIPISHPEYCDAHLVSDFTLSLGDGLAVFDFILTISNFTAEKVKLFISERGLRSIPVIPVPLAHFMNENKPESKSTGLNSRLSLLLKRPYVLMVSTIEARKNHQFLVAIWRMLVEEQLNPPDLVFVGRQGWRVNDLMEQLRATENFNGRIHILHDLSDSELESLYLNCRFTAFPSFVEGWGLPVGESLAYGKPCIASGTSSIPEVGRDLVDYIDPYNLRGAIPVFKRLIIDDNYLAQRSARIEAEFSPRDWNTVARNMVEEIASLQNINQSPWKPPILYPGEVFSPSQTRLGTKVPENYPTRPLRLLLSEGWFAPEASVVWMRNTCAVIKFSTDQTPGETVIVYLELAGSPTHTDASLSITMPYQFGERPEFPQVVTNNKKTVAVKENGRFRARVYGCVQDDKTIEIVLSVTGNIPIVGENDKRHLCVGLIALCYALQADAALRTDIKEALEMI